MAETVEKCEVCGNTEDLRVFRSTVVDALDNSETVTTRIYCVCLIDGVRPIDFIKRKIPSERGSSMWKVYERKVLAVKWDGYESTVHEIVKKMAECKSGNIKFSGYNGKLYIEVNGTEVNIGDYIVWDPYHEDFIIVPGDRFTKKWKEI